MGDAVNPVRRIAYIHLISIGAQISTTTDGGPKQVAKRRGAPNTVAYMNERDRYTSNSEWQHDYYGAVGATYGFSTSKRSTTLQRVCLF
jgi:hypothetical protein